MRSKSLVKLPNNNQKRKDNSEYDVVGHRKQIQGTLRELHQLQSQIYDLNVAQNPHSSSPVKKQIKQLSYLYENMVKPKDKNQLGIKSKDIELALRIMNKDFDQDTQLDKQLQQQPTLLMNSTAKNSKNSRDHSYKINKDTLKYKFQQLTNEDLNVDFITHGNPDSNLKSDQEISVRQLYNFVNYNECDEFDPVEEAYNMFINPDNGKFDMNIYNQFSQILGFPKIKNWNTFLSAIHQIQGRQAPTDPSTITLKQFRNVFNFKL